MVLPFLFSGCSAEDWTAKLHIVKAEDYVTKAYQLKSKKMPYEQRIDLYRRACDEYSRAYEINPDVFTFMRIEEAADTCWKAENKLEEAKFLAFKETYIKAHPTEAEYGGDAAMMPMG